MAQMTSCRGLACVRVEPTSAKVAQGGPSPGLLHDLARRRPRAGALTKRRRSSPGDCASAVRKLVQGAAQRPCKAAKTRSVAVGTFTALSVPRGQRLFRVPSRTSCLCLHRARSCPEARHALFRRAPRRAAAFCRRQRRGRLPSALRRAGWLMVWSRHGRRFRRGVYFFDRVERKQASRARSRAFCRVCRAVALAIG